jgi:hypothetical protein
MSSTQSVSNNCNRPLTAADTFTGAWESSAGALVLGVFIASPTLGLLTIQQSNNRGTTIQLTDTFNINAAELDNMNVFRVPSGFPFFRVLFQNAEGLQTYLSLNTYLEDFYNQTTITGVVDVTGSVVASNLITETLATRRVDFLVVGDYYRVASVGITSGAEWNQIGAIVDGESVPVIGRLFKCLAIGPAVQNGGTCYDVEYTDTVSATVTNLITETLATRRVDFLVVGDYYRVASVGITTGAQWNTIGAIVGGESSPVIGRLFKCLAIGPAVAGGGECFDVQLTDEVSATITNFPATQAVSGTVSLTDPTTVRIRDTYGDPIVTTAGNLMVGIGNIYTANPLHTILDSGSVGISTSANTIKIDQTSVATNGVRTIAPDTFSARVSSASSTGVQVSSGGHLLNFLANNLGSVTDAYIKLYDSVLIPVPATDTPFLIAHVSRDAGSRLPTIQVNTANLKITNNLWVRAVTGSADNNTDVTSLSVDLCFFGTTT